MIIFDVIRRGVIAAGTFAALAAFAAPAGAQAVNVTINGSPVNISPPPIVQAGRTFVPLRGVFENLGASVVYDAGQINAQGDGHDVSLHIGSTQATVDGNPQTIDVAPFIIGASTYVPLRFISQALGATVDYDASDYTVAISSAYSQPAPVALAPPSYAQNYPINQPPPPLPYYDQPPPVPEPNYIWQPGYWAWGPGGYYWVPGCWVPAPQPQLVWTPPFWSFLNGLFGFHQGYWAHQVGFYGGINYGGGYFGDGYSGGRWNGNDFAYNTAVSPVENTTVITNTYVDKTVINNYNNSTVNHVSYNGGPSGTSAHATQEELAVERGPHVPPTSVQVQHQNIAREDRSFLATANGGKPPVVTAPRAFTPEVKPAGFTPITTDDKAAAAKFVVKPPTPASPVRTPAPQVQHYVAPPVDHPAVAKPAATPYHAPAPAYHAPVAPVYHAPVTPAYHAPVTPAYRAPVHTAPPAPRVLYRAPQPVPKPKPQPQPKPQAVHHTPPPKPDHTEPAR